MSILFGIRKSRSERIAEAVGTTVAQVVLLLPFGGWALMLGLGILHHEATVAVPPLGFWTCVTLVSLAACVKSAVAPNLPEDD
jgi:uncharacterized membrane protein